MKMLRKIYRKTYKTLFSKYDVLIEYHIQDCKNILDVGCGSYSPIHTFKNEKYAVGVDAFAPSIEISKQKKMHDDYFVLNILELDKQFLPNSFDVVMALDVIEHQTKENGWKLMEQMEQIANKKIIFYTPNGFLKQGDRFSNPWQVHHSGWSVEEFTKAGYQVYGVNGLKSLRGEFAKVKYRPAFLWNFISDITELMVVKNPKKAFQLLAIKTK